MAECREPRARGPRSCGYDPSPGGRAGEQAVEIDRDARRMYFSAQGNKETLLIFHNPRKSFVSLHSRLESYIWGLVRDREIEADVTYENE